MKKFKEINATGRITVETVGADGFRGIIKMPNWGGSIICSVGAGWEHVSVSPFRKSIIPSWNDMCIIKDMFWYDHEAVIQVHPPKEEYVNQMPNCLHLWRCTYKEMVLPPSVLVGRKEGQTTEEVREALKEAYRIAGEWKE